MNRNEPKFKRFFAVGVVALCAVISAVLVMRGATRRMTNELLQFASPTTAQQVTAAQNEVNNVPDPRPTLPTEERSEEMDEEVSAQSAAAPSESAADASGEETTKREPQREEANTTQQTTAAQATTQAAASYGNTAFVLPLEQTQMQKAFSPDAPVQSETMHDWRTHAGVDFAAEAGSAVRSVGNGKVIKVIADPRWGYTLEVDYGVFTARYSALSQDGAAGIDTEVHTGETLGTLAEIPLESADAPHLHFEVYQNGVPVDPMQALGLES